MGFQGPARDQAGFGLVEVLVAFGLLSVLVLGVSSLTTTSQKASRSLALSVDWTSTVQSLGLIFTHEKSCGETNLVGMVLDPGTVSPAVQGGVYEFERLAHEPNPVDRADPEKYILRKGKEKPFGILVDKIAITAMTNVGTVPQSASAPNLESYLTTIRVEAQKVNNSLDKVISGVRSGGIVGKRNLSTEFKVVLLLDPATNTVQGCYAELSPAAMCRSMEGFDWIVNPNTGVGKCKGSVVPQGSTCGFYFQTNGLNGNQPMQWTCEGHWPQFWDCPAGYTPQCWKHGGNMAVDRQCTCVKN